jgi:hypothetical protein
MKYPFLLLLGMVMLSTLVFVMLMSALLAELDIFLDRKRESELEPAD